MEITINKDGSIKVHVEDEKKKPEQTLLFGKAPIYKLGSADPVMFARGRSLLPVTGANLECVTKGFTSTFGGCDTRVFLDDKVIGNVQGICFGTRTAGIPGGSLTLIIFDDTSYTKLLGTVKHLAVSAANEYGKLATLYNARIKFDSIESFGISIDDIVIEVNIDFEVLSRSFDEYIPPNQRKESKDATGEVPAGDVVHSC